MGSHCWNDASATFVPHFPCNVWHNSLFLQQRRGKHGHFVIAVGFMFVSFVACTTCPQKHVRILTPCSVRNGWVGVGVGCGRETCCAAAWTYRHWPLHFAIDSSGHYWTSAYLYERNCQGWIPCNSTGFCGWFWPWLRALELWSCFVELD